MNGFCPVLHLALGGLARSPAKVCAMSSSVWPAASACPQHRPFAALPGCTRSNDSLVQRCMRLTAIDRPRPPLALARRALRASAVSRRATPVKSRAENTERA